MKWRHSHPHIQDGHRLRSNLMCLSSLVRGPFKYTITTRHCTISKVTTKKEQKTKSKASSATQRQTFSCEILQKQEEKKKLLQSPNSVAKCIKTVIPKEVWMQRKERGSESHSPTSNSAHTIPIQPPGHMIM